MTFVCTAILGATILLAGVASPSADAAPKRVGDKSGWRVDQMSDSEGPIKLLLAESGLKISCPKQKLLIVARAPTWDVAIFNEKEKIGKVMKLEAWAIAGYKVFAKDTASKVQSKTRSTWQGHPAERLIKTVTGADPLKEKFEMLYRDSEGRSLAFTSEEFLFEKWMNLRPEVRHFLTGLYRVPPASGLLLERTRKYTNGRRDIALKTVSCERVAINPTDIVYPKILKTVEKISEITMEKKKRQQAAGVLEEMLFEN